MTTKAAETEGDHAKHASMEELKAHTLERIRRLTRSRQH
jgi:hypothetical protein